MKKLESQQSEPIDEAISNISVFSNAIKTILNEVIDSAVRDHSVDPDFPDEPPKDWQMLFVLLDSERVQCALVDEFAAKMFSNNC
jgi:hypothetical protein